MKFEYYIPFVTSDWKPLRATTADEAARELARMGVYGEEARLRDAETKAPVKRGDPFGRNGGVRCDRPAGGGPCSCGAWH